MLIVYKTSKVTLFSISSINLLSELLQIVWKINNLTHKPYSIKVLLYHISIINNEQSYSMFIAFDLYYLSFFRSIIEDQISNHYLPTLTSGRGSSGRSHFRRRYTVYGSSRYKPGRGTKFLWNKIKRGLCTSEIISS